MHSFTTVSETKDSSGQAFKIQIPLLWESSCFQSVTVKCPCSLKACFAQTALKEQWNVHFQVKLTWLLTSQHGITFSLGCTGMQKDHQLPAKNNRTTKPTVLNHIRFFFSKYRIQSFTCSQLELAWITPLFFKHFIYSFLRLLTDLRSLW